MHPNIYEASGEQPAGNRQSSEPSDESGRSETRNTPLFRREVSDRHSGVMEGEVLVLPSASATLITAVLLIWLGVAIFFLAGSDYTRKETVRGWVEPVSGMSTITSPVAGTLVAVYVKEGEQVQAGAPLLAIGNSQYLETGERTSALVSAEYDAQSQLLKAQLQRVHELFAAREQENELETEAARRQSRLLSSKADSLRKRLALARAGTERMSKLRAESMISESDMMDAYATELEMETDLQSVEAEKAREQDKIDQLVAARTRLRIERQDAIESVMLRASELAEKQIAFLGTEGRTLRAPRGGVVENLQARVGSPIASDTTLLTIVPRDQDATLIARLVLPIRASGFVKVGQPVQLRYDAFPYQKFGVYRGTIVSTSQVAVLPAEFPLAGENSGGPAYLLSAELESPYASAYGTNVRLKAGMTVSAEVHLDTRSLLEWLAEPLLTLGGS